jgi:hypothetical protein
MLLVDFRVRGGCAMHVQAHDKNPFPGLLAV